MATSIQINAVVDAVVLAFDSNPELWSSFLTRAKLETELAAIESEIRKKQAEADAEAAENVAELSVLAAQKAATIAAIDAL